VFNSMRIRTKLVVAMLVPLLALAALAWVAIGAANQDADEAAEKADAIEAQVDMATSSIGPAGAISAIQDERNNVAIDLIGMSAVISSDAKGDGGLQESYDATDTAVADFRKTIEKASPAVQEAYAPTLKALDGLDRIRSVERTFEGKRDNKEGIAVSVKAFDQYTELINVIFDVNGQIALGIDDPELRSGARFIDQMSRYADREAILIKTLVFPLLFPDSEGFFADRISHRLAVGLVELNRGARHEMETTGTPFYQDMARDHFENEVVVRARKIFEGAIVGEPVDLAAVLGDDTTKSILAHEGTRDAAARQLAKDARALVAQARAESDDAASDARLVTIFTAAVMALAVAIALVASRSIARPLRRLVGDAESMANTSLPGTVQSILDTPLGEDVVLPELHQVEAGGGHEIAELAAALNTVQSSAVGLAGEQAILRRNISDSFVNLGRRNQNLLDRQLRSISDMEDGEPDPDTLEKLFTLDHLATRMRRNAESLLILAGMEPHRQRSAPVPLIDVFRGALGEVEDYQRVEISGLNDVSVAGSTAVDLTHLLAELIENALNFSPPSKNVTLVGESRAGGYVVTIVDHGIGMEAEDLAVANKRLAGRESFTVAPSRYLGHYVVGVQAQRLGVTVTVQETPGGGVTATIDISNVLAEVAEGEQGSTSPESDEVAGVAAPHVVDAPATAAPATNGAPDGAANGSEPRRPVHVARAPSSDAGEPEPAGTTDSGLSRRVRGQNLPQTDVVLARSGSPVRSNASDSTTTDTADSIRSMLSGLQAGTNRALAEVDGRDDAEER
jgi:signal transduction histidine kinase